MDLQNEQAWVMLARIAAAVDGPAATISILEEALKHVPDSGNLKQLQQSIEQEYGQSNDQ